jgi:RNA polymerase sigma-B factor
VSSTQVSSRLAGSPRSWEARLLDARRTRDPAERAALIEEFMPLAQALAWRFHRSNDAHADLVQVACVGLVKAVDRFDPERGVKFSSFAVPTILGELQRHLRDRTWRLHMPRKLQNLILALGPVTEALSAELQRAPTVAELATCMLVGPDQILDARQAADSQWKHSLDQPAHEGGSEPLAETLGGDDRELTRAEHAVVLEGWLAELPQREREILRLRFEQDLTQHEIAQRIGISQMHVSRLLRRSLEALGVMAGRS